MADKQRSLKTRSWLRIVGLVLVAIVVYVALAAVFRLLEVRLPGGRVAAGLSYGILFGGLWLIGMLESSLILGTPVAHELTMGIADFIPIVVLGVPMVS